MEKEKRLYTEEEVMEAFEFCQMGLNGSRTKYPQNGKELFLLILRKQIKNKIKGGK